MSEKLKNIRKLDPSATVVPIINGPNKGKYYVSHYLRIPPHASYEAPLADSEEGAIAALWQWISDVPEGSWISRSSDRRSYRWVGGAWIRWARPNS